MSSKSKTGTVIPSHSNSKVNYQMLEQEKNMLKITLDYVAKENESLKQHVEDMKMTVKHNKELLKEYIERITNKDKVVEKMNFTIEQLTSKLHTLEEFIKQNNFKIHHKEEKKGKINTLSPKSANYISVSDLNRKAGILKTPNILSSSENTASTTPQTQNYTKENMMSIKRKTNLTSQHHNLPINYPEIVLPSAKTQSNDQVKEFFVTQNRIMEEMNTLKDDLQFIKENKTKSKLKETLEQSYRSMNNSIIDDTSSVNNSLISNVSSNNMRKNCKYNLKEKFSDMNMAKLKDFLNSYNPSKNILLFVDSKNNIWELIKRNDLNLNILNYHCENIISATSGLFTNKFLNEDGEDSQISKFLNIEIKENSLNNSELDISKMTDFNFMREELEN